MKEVAISTIAFWSLNATLISAAIFVGYLEAYVRVTGRTLYMHDAKWANVIPLIAFAAGCFSAILLTLIGASSLFKLVFTF